MTPQLNKKTCPSCGNRVNPDATVCDNCGEDMTRIQATPSVAPVLNAPEERGPDTVRCSSCGAGNPGSQQFCGSCGARLGASNRERRPARPQQASGSQKKTSGKKQQTSSTIHIAVKPWQLFLVAGIIVAGFVLVILLMRPTGQPTTGELTTSAPQAGATVDIRHLDELKTAADTNPNDPKLRIRYANALHDSKLWQQAIAEYQRYLAAEPTDVNARVDLGVCHFELSQFDSAIREMEQAVGMDPQHVLGHFNLGIVHKAAGNSEKAAEYFRKTIALTPNSQTAEQARAILAEMGQSN